MKKEKKKTNNSLGSFFKSGKNLKQKHKRIEFKNIYRK